MADPFMSEIRIVSFGFAPRGWALCDGQLLPINQNQALFSLLGTTYGGDGRVNFALPSLQGRTPIHMGNGHTLGERGGEQSHTVIDAELPTHTHPLNASPQPGDDATPLGHVLASPLNLTYRDDTPGAPLVAGSIASGGGSQAHLNMQPFLTLNLVIALSGIFPSQN